MIRSSDNKACPGQPATTRAGFSLIELLIVLAVLGIVTGAVLTHLQSTVNDRLQAAAQVVVTDLYYVRNLSVANNSSYRLTFAPPKSQYYFEHSGGNAALDTLPVSPHGGTAESPTRQSTDFAIFSMSSSVVEVVAVHVLTPAPVHATTLEFGPLGETTRSEETQIWLAAGLDDARRYVPVIVNPVTGNATIGEHATTLPVAGQAPSGTPSDSPLEGEAGSPPPI